MADRESDHLKVDTSDRPSGQRPKKTANNIKISRQHITVIVAIAILILLVIGINSVLTPSNNQPSLLLPKEPSPTSVATTVSENSAGETTPTQESLQTQSDGQYKQIAPQPISATPTQSQTNTNTGYKERVEVPGDIADLLAEKTPIETKTVNNDKAHVSKDDTAKITQLTLKSGLPATHFTIQISASSNKANLAAYAKKHNLDDYLIYETRRENKPWFVLIIGNYATPVDAKQAITALPAEVQTQKPWVKSGLRVQEEQQQK